MSGCIVHGVQHYGCSDCDRANGPTIDRDTAHRLFDEAYKNGFFDGVHEIAKVLEGLVKKLQNDGPTQQTPVDEGG